MNSVKIAVIGGSGLYNLEGLTTLEEVYPETPWGYPSDKIVIAQTKEGVKVAFLARHGRGHSLNPSEVPARANIAALKSLNVEVILAFSAVGSLREEIAPCDFVLPNQIIDRTKGIRPSTFFEDDLTAHVPFADPFCKPLADLITAQGSPAMKDGKIHTEKTLVCMEGPAFSTRAESHLYRSWGCDVINMSVLPEAKLAREAEIAYQMICMATDYDCWREMEEAVSVQTVVANMTANARNARNLTLALIDPLDAALREQKPFSHMYKGTMRHACMTAPDNRSPDAVKKLEYLLPGYYTP